MGRLWKRPAGWPPNSMAMLCVDGRQVFVTVHAARRWAQRVRNDPRRQLKEIRPDLERIAAACGAWSFSPPPWWVPAVEGAERQEGWVTFGPDIAMPVRDRVATTTLTRGSTPDEARDRKRLARQKRAAWRRAKAKEHGRKGRSWGKAPSDPAGNAVTMLDVPETGGDDGRNDGRA